MNVWTWFAAPPAILLAAYFSLGTVSKEAVRPLPPPPAVEPLRLPASLTAAGGGASYQRGGAPKEIRLAAFGVIVPESVAGSQLAATVPPAKDMFVLQSVLLADQNRSATIDGEIYKEGDKFRRRYRLVKVEPDAVWLKGPRGREVLRFPEFKDQPVIVAAAPQVALQSPGKPALTSPTTANANPGKLDSEYRKILEMLKL